jgi:hypothetical protein
MFGIGAVASSQWFVVMLLNGIQEISLALGQASNSATVPVDYSEFSFDVIWIFQTNDVINFWMGGLSLSASTPVANVRLHIEEITDYS